MHETRTIILDILRKYWFLLRLHLKTQLKTDILNAYPIDLEKIKGKFIIEEGCSFSYRIQKGEQQNP